MELQILGVKNNEMQEAEDIKFNWTVTSVNDFDIQIQLAFEDPLLLSNDSDFDFHSIQVQILHPDLFFSVEGEIYRIKDAEQVLMARIA